MSTIVRIEVVTETKDVFDVIYEHLHEQGFETVDVYFNDEDDNLICVEGDAALSFDLEQSLKSIGPEITGVEYKLWDLNREPDQEGEF